MALTYKVGDIFDSTCQTLVNTVNCEGVMGKGLALQFKTQYPLMFTAYRKACRCGDIRQGGDIWIYTYHNTYQPNLFELEDKGVRIGTPLKILCFATKEHWRNKSQYNWIIRGLQAFRAKYKEWGITSIAFPKLGCTNGGLDWDQVQYYMETLLRDLDIPVEIWVPEESDLPRMTKQIQFVKNTEDFII